MEKLLDGFLPGDEAGSWGRHRAAGGTNSINDGLLRSRARGARPTLLLAPCASVEPVERLQALEAVLGDSESA